MSASTIYNVIILDESGSMSSIHEQTVLGFENIIQNIKSIAKEFPHQVQKLTFLTFNSLNVQKYLAMENTVNDRFHFQFKNYSPNGGTPLYDAIGKTITNLLPLDTKNDQCSFLVTIITDGYENSSIQYNHASIANMIESLSKRNWTFTYIGADHDVEKVANDLNINNTMQFFKTDEDLNRMFEIEKYSRREYMNKASKGFIDKMNYFKNKK